MIMERLLGGAIIGTRPPTNLFTYSLDKIHSLKINNNYKQSSNFVMPCWGSNMYSSSSSFSGGSVAAGKAELPVELREESLPKHVAVILDGCRRWSKSKGIPTTYMGLYDASTVFAQNCAKWGIPFASSFIYLSENWPWQDLIFGESQFYLEKNLDIFMRDGIRISVIGEISTLPKALQEAITKVEEETMNNTRVDLIFGINYGGRRDIVQATRKLGAKIKDGLLKPQEIDEALLEKELWTNIGGRVIPNPDLLIRTGGQIRMSNYMMWQMAFTELYFNDLYGPDFDDKEFVKALLSFQSRKRNFGK